MKFDAIIIGGGHSGLEKGIELLKSGRTCLAFASGEGGHRFRDAEYSHASHRREFQSLGGVFVMGDTVTGGEFDSTGRLDCIYAANQGGTRFSADCYYLATGSFFSRGVVALRDSVVEPVFGLDVDYTGTSEDWLNPDFSADQPFMHFGVRTDAEGHPFRNGCKVPDMIAIGSVVSSLEREKEER